MRRFSVLLVLLLLPVRSAWGAPRNVILLIGDGMGFAHVAAARIKIGGPDCRLAMDSMPVTGMVTTHSANSLITDSAAAATAFATGIKTNNGMLGQAPDGRPVKTILDAARELGKATGLVTTTTITHATPAAFASHIDSRSRQADIAGQMIEARVDVMFGGGRAFFIPKSNQGSQRPDERDLIKEAAAIGYRIVGSGNDLNGASGPKVLGLFSTGNLTTREPEPPLSTLAGKAIEILSTDQEGFFLMVEGGLIDAYGHSNDFDGMVRQLLEFDRAVSRALEFARKDGGTLVIVTADHETGGLSLLVGEDGQLKPAWATGGHTGIVVPLYAFGPDAERFAGLMDNTDVGRMLARLWRVTIGLEGARERPIRAETTSRSELQ